MKRTVTVVLAVTAAAVFSEILTPASSAADVPSDRVVVMYFHRTQRCPTCRKMGSYSEEAVKDGFPQELQDGKVEFHLIDFQAKKNAALTKGYGVTGPALIVAQVKENKVAGIDRLTEIWTHAGDKAAFLKYVQEHVTAALK